MLKTKSQKRDKVILSDLQAFSKLGIYDFEKELGQSIIINLELELDLNQAGQSDDVKDTIDYADISTFIRRFTQSKDFGLIEYLAQEIVNELFKRYSKIEGIEIEVKKTIVNAEHFSGTPSVRIYRERRV